MLVIFLWENPLRRLRSIHLWNCLLAKLTKGTSSYVSSWVLLGWLGGALALDRLSQVPGSLRLALFLLCLFFLETPVLLSFPLLG